MAIEVAVTPRWRDTEAVVRDAGREVGRASSREGAVDAVAYALRSSAAETGLNFEFHGGIGECRASAKLLNTGSWGEGNTIDEAVADALLHGGAERAGIRVKLDMVSPFAYPQRQEEVRLELQAFGPRVLSDESA